MAQRTIALITGNSLILMAVLAGIAYGYIFQGMLFPPLETLTISHINSLQVEVRVFIFLFTGILVLDVLVAWGLYEYFKKPNELISTVTAWFRLIYTALLGLALISCIDLLQLMKSGNITLSEYTNGLNLFLDAWSFGLIIFGIHLLFLARLIHESAEFPKWMAWLMVLAGFSYFGNNTAYLLFSDYAPLKETVEMILTLPMALSELTIAIWLIWKGGKK